MESPPRRKFGQKKTPATPKRTSGLFTSIKSVFTSPSKNHERGSHFKPWPAALPLRNKGGGTRSQQVAGPSDPGEDVNPFWDGAGGCDVSTSHPPTTVPPPPAIHPPATSYSAPLDGDTLQVQPQSDLSISNKVGVEPLADLHDEWDTDDDSEHEEVEVNEPNKKPKALANNSIVGLPTHASELALKSFKPPSERMKDFLGHSCAAMDALLSLECPPASMVCSGCTSKARQRGNCPMPPHKTCSALYRCTSCFHAEPTCASCILEDHRTRPLHVLQKWCRETQFWTRSTLNDLGFVLNLGHGGQRCVVSTRNPRELVVVHADGVDSLRVSFCNCIAPGDCHAQCEPDFAQLIRRGFWPGSWHLPRTVYTLDILDKFSILSHQAHTNANDFFTFLKRITDNVNPDQVAVGSFFLRTLTTNHS